MILVMSYWIWFANILKRILHLIKLYKEKAMAPHSSTLAWKIPWVEEPGKLQSMGSLRVGHDWGTSLSFFTFMHWRRKWQPTPVFFHGGSQGWGAWWAAIYGIAQSWTWLKWLSSKLCNHRKLANLIKQITALPNSMKLRHAVWGHQRQTGHGGEVWQKMVH